MTLAFKEIEFVITSRNRVLTVLRVVESSYLQSAPALKVNGGLAGGFVH